MTILRRELRSNFKGLLIWTIALALLNFLLIAIYPTMAADKAALDEMMEMYPEAMVKMFGMEKLIITDPLGFYGIEAYFMVVLFGSIYAAILGSGILAKEEDEKTIEFLLAKPVTRTRIIAEKALTWITNLLLFNVVIALVSWLSFQVFDMGDYSATTLFWMLLAPLFIHLIFASLGFLSALFFTRRKSALSVSIGLVLGLYFVNTIALLADKFSFLGWITPFKYMDAGDIFIDGSINPWHTLGLLAVSALAVLTTWKLYQKRDITI